MTDKILFMECKKCRAQITMRAENSKQILMDIDKSGWIDRPAAGGGIEFLCPTCAKEEAKNADRD